jgi:glutaredoxin-like YruB-family protein
MKVKVYSTQWCPWCTKVKDWLKENKVKFEEKNVGEDQEAAVEMIEKTGQRGVPVTIYTDDKGKEHVIVGYNVPELEKLKGD